MPNPAPAMPTADEFVREFNEEDPRWNYAEQCWAVRMMQIRDAQWSARLAAVERENWTPTLIDAINSFVRENAAKFDPCKDGPSAADLIRDIHGEYNGLRSRLAEAEATRDACLSMATIDKETTMEKQSLRAKLAGEISVNGEPMSAPPPKPDLSKWPEWEAVEYRAPQISDWFVGVDCMKGQPVECLSDYYKEHDKRWILRRRTPAPPPDAADEGPYRVVEGAPDDGWYGIVGPGVDGASGAEERKPAELICADFNRAYRAGLAAQRPKAVDVEEAAKAAYETPIAGTTIACAWANASDSDKENAREEARTVILFCGCTVAEKGDDLIERMERLANDPDTSWRNDEEKTLREAIERLRGSDH